MAELYFVSKNENKFQEIRKILDMDVEWYKMDIPELQTDDDEKLIKKKALDAFKEIRRPVLVEHTAFRIHAFNNLPGLQTSYFYTQIGYKAIVDYCIYKDDFAAFQYYNSGIWGSWEKQMIKHFSAKKGNRRQKDSFSVFDAILIFSVRVLQEFDGEPVCKYDQLLRWRMTSHELEEEIFTTAYLAYKDAKNVNRNRSFSWRPVIRHNNIYLNRILSQGMADNHFHLKGSAPQFPLSWISMMNNVTSKRFHYLLDHYSEKRLSTIYYTGADDSHLYISYLKAALIRSYLFSKLIGQEFIIANNAIGNYNNSEEESKEKREHRTERL